MYTTSCSLPLPGDVCRFDLSHIPLTCLASSGPDIYHSPEDVVEWQGVAWGTDGYVHSKHSLYNGHCVYVYYGNSMQ